MGRLYADCSSPARPRGKRPAGRRPRRDTDRTGENPTGERTWIKPLGTRGRLSWTLRPPPARTTGPSCGKTRTPRAAPRGTDAHDDDEVPHCAQFADLRLMMKARKPPEDEGGVPHCAQFADVDTIAAARKQRERWGGNPELGDDAHSLAPDPAAPSRPDPGPAPPRPPIDPTHCRDPAEDQEELPSQDTQSPAENDQTTHDVPVLDCDEAELEAMVAELNEDPSADHDAVETPDGGQQRGGTFTIPKLLAILFGLLASLTTTGAQRVTVPNGTS